MAGKPIERTWKAKKIVKARKQLLSNHIDMIHDAISTFGPAPQKKAIRKFLEKKGDLIAQAHAINASRAAHEAKNALFELRSQRDYLKSVEQEVQKWKVLQDDQMLLHEIHAMERGTTKTKDSKISSKLLSKVLDANPDIEIVEVDKPMTEANVLKKVKEAARLSKLGNTAILWPRYPEEKERPLSLREEERNIESGDREAAFVSAQEHFTESGAFESFERPASDFDEEVNHAMRNLVEAKLNIATQQEKYGQAIGTILDISDIIHQGTTGKAKSAITNRKKKQKKATKKARPREPKEIPFDLPDLKDAGKQKKLESARASIGDILAEKKKG